MHINGWVKSGLPLIVCVFAVAELAKHLYLRSLAYF